MNIDELFTSMEELPEPLTKSQFNCLLKEAKEGVKEAREEIIIHNIRLVIHEVLSKFGSINYDKSDLISIGNLGLVRAVDTFDLEKGYEFSTYAARCIDNEIYQFLRRWNKKTEVCSLESIVAKNNDDDALTLKDVVSYNVDFTEEYEKAEIRKIVRDIVLKMPEGRDKEIILFHFGFKDGVVYTQRDIANKFNVAQSWISRLEMKTLEKIKRKLQYDGVIESRDLVQESSKEQKEEKKKVLLMK